MEMPNYPIPESSSMTIVRFAPSPTGHIHVGNVRTALINWLFAKARGGRFLLRLDDTDTERATREFADAIEADLTWLGLGWDLHARQSERFDRHDEIRDRLIAGGRLYPAYETPGELDRKRRRQQARGMPPVYDRAALALSVAEKAAFEAEGRRPHWRFRLDQETVVFDDLIRGEIKIDAASLSDPVLIREDGTYLYTLCSIVDDIDFGVTHVIRGEDHVANTGVQVQIFKILGADVPGFGHHPLLVGADGGPLSKRLGSLSIGSLRDEGYEPMALTSLLAKIGTSDPVEARAGMGELLADFSIDKISRSPARFDLTELEKLNAELLRAMPYEAAQPRLADLGVDGGTGFWDIAREDMHFFSDVIDRHTLVAGPIEPIIEDPELCAVAAKLLPEGEWSEHTWGVWTGAIKERTGARGKTLFMPLRRALTGRERGPEMARLLPQIPRETVLARLKGNAA